MRKNLFFIYFVILLLFTGCSNRDRVVAPDNQALVKSADSTENILEDFINQTGKGISLSAKYSSDEGYKTQNIILTSKIVKNFENGIIYEISLDTKEEFPIKRFPFYMYVLPEKIYRIWADLEQIEKMKTEADIIKNSAIVYQKLALDDELAEEEQGIHHYIIADESIKESHYFQLNEYANVVGYYETFRWEEGKGLTLYRSGFGANADFLELINNE